MAAIEMFTKGEDMASNEILNKIASLHFQNAQYEICTQRLLTFDVGPTRYNVVVKDPAMVGGCWNVKRAWKVTYGVKEWCKAGELEEIMSTYPDYDEIVARPLRDFPKIETSPYCGPVTGLVLPPFVPGVPPGGIFYLDE